MLTECNPTLMRFARLKGRDVVADFGGGTMTSDAGALLLGATDRAIGLVERFAGCFGRSGGGSCCARCGDDGGSACVRDRVTRTLWTMTSYAPVLGAILERLEARRQGCAPLAGKSTLNRLEHAPEGHALPRDDPSASTTTTSAAPLPPKAANQATRGPRFEGTKRMFGKTEDPPSDGAGTRVRRDRSRRQVCGISRLVML